MNFGAKALRIYHIFGVKTLPFLCQIVTIKSGLVRERDTFWCENKIFHFSGLVPKREYLVRIRDLCEENLLKIMELLNEIIATRNFQLPEILKSRFSLLYKGHNKSRLNIDNYRQITVLQIFNRVFNRILVYRGYGEFIMDNIGNNQYGFTKNLSAE